MKKTYMLDTDACSYIIRGNDARLAAFVAARANDDICISSITASELLFGIRKKNSQPLTDKVTAFLGIVRIVDFDIGAAEHYSEIRLALESGGNPIGNMDVLIAACARSIGATLITNNVRHFSKVPGLMLENWCEDS